MSGTTFSYEFDGHYWKGKSEFPTGVFINNEFKDGAEGTTIDVINPTTGKLLTKVSEATAKDVDLAVQAARQAFETTWGVNTMPYVRGLLLNKLADLMERDSNELIALEVLDNGKTWGYAKNMDLVASIVTLRYFAGWADKITGQSFDVDSEKFAYTRHEPIGVCGGIIPWNFPLIMFTWKIGPALATGNTCIVKPSEFTPLTALKMASLIKEAGFPPGVVNVLVGYGHTAGSAISSHMDIDKVAFTGSTLVGRKIMEAAAKSNLKPVTLELGGKSPSIVYDDADLDEAVPWVAHGIYFNHGQCCTAGSRVFVQEGIYDKFLEKFTEETKKVRIGDPFAQGMSQGPQINQAQYDRIMGYIESGKKEGATVHLGGDRFGNEGFFINPTIFTNTKPDMKIVREEIFGPVVVVIKFKTDEEAISMANDTTYGLASSVFSQNINRAMKTAHKLKAGTAWINSHNDFSLNAPFGGYKQSGIGRECGSYALDNYTNVKAVHVNFDKKPLNAHLF